MNKVCIDSIKFYQQLAFSASASDFLKYDAFDKMVE